MFKKGDIITGTENGSNTYSYTTSHALMIVARASRTGQMFVYILASTDYNVNLRRECWDVDNSDSKFVKITPAEYFSKYESQSITILDNNKLNSLSRNYNFEFNMLQAIVNNTEIITKSTTEPYVLSDDKRKELIQEMTKLLEKYSYHPTEYGLNKVIDKWAKNKGDLIRMLENHPNYNGKFQIVFDYDYERQIDSQEIRNFFGAIYDRQDIREQIMEVSHISVFSYKECCSYKKKFNNMLSWFNSYSFVNSINGMSYEDVLANYDKWRDIIVKYESKCEIYDGVAFSKESHNQYIKYRDVVSFMYSYHHSTLDENIAKRINNIFPDLKAVAGQKTSKFVNKFCKKFGLDKIESLEYNRKFAKYSDAINPLTIKRHTILSVHPIDYYTMSFGNSWASCHTIDKHNIRNMDNAYHGQYSGGTESYMLDGTSMVFYTVDNSYNGNKYELEPKINRNMFHFGYDKLIQGRVYPQSNDGANDIYKTFREITQKIVADCLQANNSWLNIKGIDECDYVTSTKGVHYADYLNFGSCNVSYLNKVKNEQRITIGHNPICPNCGYSHDWEECIECYDCYED